MLVYVRPSVSLRQRNKQNDGLYELKVSVCVLNTVNNYLADVSG